MVQTGFCLGVLGVEKQFLDGKVRIISFDRHFKPREAHIIHWAVMDLIQLQWRLSSPVFLAQLTWSTSESSVHLHIPPEDPDFRERNSYSIGGCLYYNVAAIGKTQDICQWRSIPAGPLTWKTIRRKSSWKCMQIASLHALMEHEPRSWTFWNLFR